MAQIKTSNFLSELFADAKGIGNKANGLVTAERFLVAIIDRMNAADENRGWDAADAELIVINSTFRKLIPDLQRAKETLMAYICQENGKSFLDDLYMRKKLQEAAKLSAESKSEEVDAAALFMCITQDPSEPIKSVLTSSAPEVADAEDSTDFSAMLNEAFHEMLAQSEDDKSPAEEKKDPKTEMADLVADIGRIRTELQSCIFGQDNAINIFVTGYFHASMRAIIDKADKHPRATFLFAGPPGVGKTFLAEKSAEILKLPFMRFDMSEYSDKEANLEFCGSDKVYKNGSEGNVTGFVAKHPRCVLLFDEIEKAHIGVIHLFLQLLDAGRLRDNHTDKEVSFKDAIVIFTTNAGRKLYEGSESGDLSTVSRKVIISALQKEVNPETGAPFFPAAICSRFASGNVVMFNHIGAHSLCAIAKKEISRQAAGFKQETGINVQVDERVYTALLFAEGSSADARTIRSRAETFFNDELYELLRLIRSDKVKTGIEQIEKIRIGVDLAQAEGNISRLFIPDEKIRVLVFAGDQAVALCQEALPEFDFVGIQDVTSAIDVMKRQRIDFVLLDILYGAPDASLNNLNIEDVQSPARDFFKFLKEQRKELPAYMLQTGEVSLDKEESVSFMRQGIRGILQITADSFADKLKNIAEGLYQQASMVKLAREKKLICFETAQTISPDGKDAQIRLFDFVMKVAVESEDAKTVGSDVSRPDIHFADVIGAEDAKSELKHFVQYIQNPEKYLGTGLKAPKGVLLYGPPGTGKTMLAKAMACESGATFIAAEGNRFLKKYVGEGPEMVHELFRTARKYAPSVVFIDEIDSIAKERRGGENAGANGEAVLTAFLTEMDGYANDPTKPVFVLAATNFDVEPGSGKSLDQALLRRFDRRVYIGLPDREARIRFLKMKIQRNPALQISDAQIDNIAMRSTGMSLASLESAVDMALRSAIRQESTVVTDAILEEAFETFNNGEVKKWDVSQLERVARHEAGHALVYWLHGQTPSYLTIVARGKHGGYMQPAEEDKQICTKQELIADIRVSLGGRAAEIAYYGERDGISTGASGDLASATRVAQQILCTYGMHDEFGLAVVSGSAAENSAISSEIRACVNAILNEQMQKTLQLISENKAIIDALVEVLLEKNHLNAAQIEEVIAKIPGAQSARSKYME